MIHYFYLFLVILGMVMDSRTVHCTINIQALLVSAESFRGEPGQSFERMDPHGHDGRNMEPVMGNAWNMNFDIIHPICLPGPMWYVQ